MTEEKNFRNIALLIPDADNDGIGLGEFENSLVEKLCREAVALKENHRIRLYLIVNAKLEGRYGKDVEYVVLDKRGIKALGSRRKCRKIMERLPRFDLIHVAHQGLRVCADVAPKRLVTVHDCNFFHNDIGFLRKLKKQWLMSRRLSAATHLAYISNFTRSDVNSHFRISVPERVIYNGITNLTTAARKRPEKHLPDSFMLHISRLAEKKNVHLLVEMMRFLPDMNLVLAGKGRAAYERELRGIIDKYNLKNVCMLGYVSREEKASLLNDCRALLFPSRSEGFGLPVVEAMCFGKPVYLSRLTSLPEVGGSEAYYFDTLEPKAMAEVVRAKQDEYNSEAQAKSERIKRHAAKFDWAKTARQYIDYYLDII